MIHRPSFKLPILAALAIAGAAYLVRSTVIRGGDFSLDTPDDLIAAAVLLLGVVLVAITRRGYSADQGVDEPHGHGDDEHGTGSDSR